MQFLITNVCARVTLFIARLRLGIIIKWRLIDACGERERENERVRRICIRLIIRYLSARVYIYIYINWYRNYWANSRTQIHTDYRFDRNFATHIRATCNYSVNRRDKLFNARGRVLITRETICQIHNEWRGVKSVNSMFCKRIYNAYVT